MNWSGRPGFARAKAAGRRAWAVVGIAQTIASAPGAGATGPLPQTAPAPTRDQRIEQRAERTRAAGQAPRTDTPTQPVQDLATLEKVRRQREADRAGRTTPRSQERTLDTGR